MTAQAEMFGDHGVSLPPGMRYFYDIISQSYEHDLVTYIANLPLKAFEFSGGFKGNRRVMSFGWRYDYDTYQLRKATPISAELADMRRVVASRFNVPIKDLKQALVTEYAPGAGSTETKKCSAKFGVSLLASCRFRLRNKNGDSWHRISLQAEPRSAYMLSGPSRTLWEHSIPPVDRLRYSITFRTLPDRR